MEDCTDKRAGGAGMSPDFDVIKDREFCEEPYVLKCSANAEFRDLVRTESRNGLPQEVDTAERRFIQTGNAVEECRLPCTRWVRLN